MSGNYGSASYSAETLNGSAPAAFAISVPTRNIMRPPAIQSFTTSRISTPVPPRVHSGQQKQSARVPSGSGIPTPIAAPPRSAPRTAQPSTLPVVPALRLHIDEQSVQSSIAESVRPGVSTITDAQIDPTLLEAVVTALQHVSRAETQPSQLSGEPAQSTDEPQLQNPQRQSKSRLSKIGQMQQEEEAGPSGTTVTTSTAFSTAGIEDEQHSDEDQGMSGSQRKRKKRSSNASGVSRKRRSRAPSIPLYDPAAEYCTAIN